LTLLCYQAIHQMHRDVVYTSPPSIELLGHSPRCDVQGMYEKKRLITVQGHPEFNGDIVSELLENRHEKGIFDDGTYKDGMDRVRKHHDGVAVSAAFIRFMLEQ
jgi:GMP synthase-like glutamine amidotransferase